MVGGGWERGGGKGVNKGRMKEMDAGGMREWTRWGREGGRGGGVGKGVMFN